MNDKLGVALTRELCVICAKDMDGPIVMNTRLTEKRAEEVKKLHNKVVGYAKKPCEECQENMKKAFMIIGFDEEKSDMDNLPEGFYRTGYIVGIKKDSDLVTGLIKEKIPGAIKKGYCFMPYDIMKQMGLLG